MREEREGGERTNDSKFQVLYIYCRMIDWLKYGINQQILRREVG